MLIFTMHWDLRALFAGLTITARFYVFGLMAAAAYSTYSSVRTMSRLKRVSKILANGANGASPRLFEITRDVENLRQLHTFLFLSFGACCANEAVAILQAIRNSSASLSAARMDIFEPVAAFAFFVFAVLLMLHIFQWVVAVRLRDSSAPN